MKNLRQLVYNILVESTHRCVDGSIVHVDSVECYNDVCARIEDASHTRDQKTRGTASRAYYNGILSDLRKEKRRLMKIHTKENRRSK